MKSLKQRLSLGLAAILIAVFTVQWMLVDPVIRHVAENQMATRLEHDGDSLLASLEFEADGKMRFDPKRLGLVYEQPLSGHYLVIHAAEQVFRSPSFAGEHIRSESVDPRGQIRHHVMGERAGPVVAQPQLNPGEQIRYHAMGPGNQPLLVLGRGFEKQGRVFSVYAGEDLSYIDAAVAAFREGFLILTVTVLAVAIIVQSLDVERALRPITAIRADLSLISRGEKVRIESTAPMEIQPLVDEINRLLGLVDRRLKQSRTATGNLAHAIKTPLAVLFNAAEHPGLAELPELRRQLQEQTATIHHRIERELRRAQLSGAGRSGAFFNPKNELTRLVRSLAAIYSLASIYRDKNLDIELIAPDCLLPYDREDMLELIGNLADNACKWAWGKVRIEVEVGEDLAVSILVADDGPGCADDEMRQLTQRGLRLDESKQGHGLGLTIAWDIVEFYGGRMEFGRDPVLGGLRVQVTLEDLQQEHVNNRPT